MSTGFVPLDALVAKLSPDDQEFFANTIKRDAREYKEDSDRSGILQRMKCDQCQKCIEDYRRKHPGRPFALKCFGIYDTPDYERFQKEMAAEGDEMSIDEIREIYDPAFWGSRHIVVKNDAGDIVPFIPRFYQEMALRCTSPRKVDRWGRGMGKTMAAVVEEMHFLCNNKNTYTLVLAPSQAQAQLWWDEVNFQIENSPTREFEVLNKKQQPYFLIRFGNGSVLGIFTAGSKSGKGADSIRSQSPRRIRLEEQDFLADKDYQAIMPLLRRFKNVTFHGSSTPTGKREMYWQMCQKLPEYKEFYHPIMDHPDWDSETLNEEVCIAEAKTMDRYRHEWLAEFGDPEAGIFKSAFVDDSMRPYSLRSCLYDPNKNYVLGVDWNGKGTGTRIVIVEFDPATRKRRVVHHEAVDDEKATSQMSFTRIVELNKMWHCDHVYIDAGFGFVQDELLKEIGVKAGTFDPDTARLKYLHVIDFGAKLETNSIVPNRDPDSKYLPDPKDDLLKRRTKPFMVEGCVQAFEMALVEISREYSLLEEQLRGYRVKTWTKGGSPDTYATDSDTGDHDLDAFMLAMLGVELNYGLWHTKESVRRLIQIAHVSGWGLPSTVVNPMMASQLTETPEVNSPAKTEQIRSIKRDAAGIPARTKADQVGQKAQQEWRLLHLARSSYIAAPPAGRQGGNGRVPSRTSMFQAPPSRTQSGSANTRFGRNF